MSVFQNNLLAAAAAASAGGDTAYQLWSWGLTSRRPVAAADTPDPPQRIADGPGDWLKATQSSSGGHGINDSGELWGWGYGTAGRIGVGNTTKYAGNTTTKYIQVGALTTWDEVSDSNTTTFAIKTDGTLWSWGKGEHGILGNGSTADICSPVQVGSLTDWSKLLTAGGAQTNIGAAIKTDGTLWTWGQGSYGGLGHGNRTSISSPVQVGSLTDWATVSGGDGSMFGTKTDGTLWAWGRNSTGRLGLGDTTNRSSPVQIGALTTWSQVAGGGAFGAALKTDGTLWAWGYNNHGQLGQGNTTTTSSPVQIGSLTTWSKITCGYYSWLSIKTDNTLWSCGRGGTFGINGSGTTNNYSSPIQIGTDTDWRVTAGAVLGLKGEAL